MRISVEEVARILSVPEETVFGWARKGKIPATRVRDQWYFHRGEVLEWATANGLAVSEELFPSRVMLAAPRLFLALETGGIYFDVPGRDRDEVLAEVVARMPVDPAEREGLTEILRAREVLGSTGIGRGIAIPHVLDPLIVADAQPTVTLCFLAEAVAFEAIDQAPVTTVFTLVSPNVRAHHHLLAELSGALHDARFLKALELRDRQELLEAARQASRKTT